MKFKLRPRIEFGSKSDIQLRSLGTYAHRFEGSPETVLNKPVSRIISHVSLSKESQVGGASEREQLTLTSNQSRKPRAETCPDNIQRSKRTAGTRRIKQFLDVAIEFQLELCERSFCRIRTKRLMFSSRVSIYVLPGLRSLSPWPGFVLEPECSTVNLLSAKVFCWSFAGIEWKATPRVARTDLETDGKIGLPTFIPLRYTFIFYERYFTFRRRPFFLELEIFPCPVTSPGSASFGRNRAKVQGTNEMVQILGKT